MSRIESVQTRGSFTKKDLLNMYGGVRMSVFEEWIEEIKPEIGWRSGKQIFPPKKAQRIIEHIGEPINVRIVDR